jgi:hypothetical protein
LLFIITGGDNFFSRFTASPGPGTATVDVGLLINIPVLLLIDDWIPLGVLIGEVFKSRGF